jgi:hypothetical protein
MQRQRTHQLTSQPHPVPRWGWLFAAGPIVWSLYFWMEARAAQVGCRVDSWPLMVWSSLAIAGMVMVTVSYHASRSQPPAGAHPAVSMMRDGFLLGAGLLAAAVLVGLPTLVTHPC